MNNRNKNWKHGFFKRLSLCCQEESWRETWNAVTSHDKFPTWTGVKRVVALIGLAFMTWGIAYAELEKFAAPQGQLFKIGLLGITAYAAGYVFALFRLPSLLGMMLVGILFRNIDYLIVTGNYMHGTKTVRQIALVILLIRAGLEVHPKALKRFWFSVLKASTVPVAVEILTVAVMTHFLLYLPWIWSFMLGSLLAAVSIAVAIPCLFRLKEEGNYGHSKGISTLVIAAASVIDVECVTIFGVLMSVAFSEGSIIKQILDGPACVLIGLVVGIIMGIFIRKIPGEEDQHVTILRTTLIGIACLFMMLGSAAIGYEGAGPLGCFVIPYVASAGWTGHEKFYVEGTFAFLWHLFQPLLFGLIGTNIHVRGIRGEVVGPGLGALGTSLLMRSATSFVVLFGENLNWKEKLFVSIAWCPKATIQAALGPMALDRAKELHKNEEENHYAQIVLILAVLSVLITAPLFDFLIIFFGTRLLEKEEPSVIEEEEEITLSASRSSIMTKEPTVVDFYV